MCQKTEKVWWPAYAREFDSNDTKAKYYDSEQDNKFNFYIGEAGNYTIQLFPLTLGVKITKN